MYLTTLTPEGLSTAAGALISILLMLLPLVPKLGEKWQNLEDAQKQAVNIVVLIVVALGAGLASCFGGFGFIVCTKEGWLNLLGNLVYAILGNAGTFVTFKHIAKKVVSKSVKPVG